jgi:endonuclease/exonuclease/phosphatase family metal-dependent hydrolase
MIKVKDRGKDDVTLVNMNVWFGLEARGFVTFGEYESGAKKKDRFKILTDGFKDLQSDVIGIQEANLLPGYARTLSAALDCDAVWKVTNSGVKIMGGGIPTNFTAGSAVLAPKGRRLKYLGARRISGYGIQSKYFSFHFKELRDVMAVLVFVRDQPIIIFNTQTHFSVVWNQRWEIQLNSLIDSYQLKPKKKENLLKKIQKGQDRRRQEISRLIAFVKRITTVYKYPYVIMGDFNTTADTREIIDLVGELNLLDAYGVRNPQKKGYTWDPGKNTNTRYDASLFWVGGVTPKDPFNRLKAEFDGNMARRIDFIFLSYQFEPDMIKKARLIFTEPTDGLFASDHFGIQVVLNRLP